jgi:DNA-directed RNA polymerase subunit D
LVPIPTDLSLLTYKDECVCKGKGCPNCTVRYTLSKEGEGTVLSGDLQPAEKSWAITEDKIPIVKLYGDQRLILEVEAVLGNTKKHAKWQAVQAPGYRTDVLIDFDSKREDEVKEFIEDIPQDIVELKKGKLILKDLKDLPILESYIDKKNIDFIDIKQDSTNFLFSFETDGSFSAKNALIGSAKILENKYSELGKLLQKIK